jgi:RNA polymerase sigma factor (sigma-70 family)
MADPAPIADSATHFLAVHRHFLETALKPWRYIERMDAAQLGRLIDDHAAALVLYARQWCAAPEDVVQDAFLALITQSRTPEPAVPWLFRVVRNGAISAARSERRRRRREASAVPQPWFLPETGHGLETAELHEALAALPLEQREFIVAHLWGGLTFEQMGELSNCSTSMAYRRYSAGVTALRERMGGEICPTKPPTRG